MYSPPRITVQAKKHGLRAGKALDLVTGYDFNKKEDRDRAWGIIRRDEPKLVAGSPECKMFNVLHNLTTWNIERQRHLEGARQHLKFICEIYEHQVEKGRMFLHEHPIAATSWCELPIRKVGKLEGVESVVTDQCMFGLKTKDSNGDSKFAKKKTRFLSNAKEILR